MYVLFDQLILLFMMIFAFKGIEEYRVKRFKVHQVVLVLDNYFLRKHAVVDCVLVHLQVLVEDFFAVVVVVGQP